ncbi:MAG: 4Fe-4S dicluster domain-containing protein, partial [Armatimonadota bacterium]
PNVTCAMSGMREMSEVEENCATASSEEPLSDEQREAIEKLIARNERLTELYCTGCEYCLPCPEGVAIPEIFMAMNYHRVWGLTEHAKRLYARLGERNAEACIECHQCEEKCPQNLPIVEQLKESHEALSG